MIVSSELRDGRGAYKRKKGRHKFAYKVNKMSSNAKQLCFAATGGFLWSRFLDGMFPGLGWMESLTWFIITVVAIALISLSAQGISKSY
jgi:hypothetical protein